MEGVEVLTREQLKKVMGGNEGSGDGGGSSGGAKICFTSSDCLPMNYMCNHADGEVTGPYSTGQGDCRWDTWYGRCYYGFVCQP